MSRQDLIALENFRLKNEITDLRNALSMNRDFLRLLSAENSLDAKTTLLFKIVQRLTQQSDEALLANLDLLQEKEVLKQQIFRLNQEVDHLEARLEQEIRMANRNDLPTLSKTEIAQQLKALNNELLASHQEKIELEQQLSHWKLKCTAVEALLQESTQPEESFEGPRMRKRSSQLSAVDPIAQPRKTRVRRRYTSNIRMLDQEKVDSLNSEIRRLKRYVEELQGRLSIFIKAYNYEENVLQRQKDFKHRRHPLEQRRSLEIELLKYATNEIQVYEREGQKFMMIRQNFREEALMPVAGRQRSWPRFKEFIVEEGLEDQYFEEISSRIAGH